MAGVFIYLVEIGNSPNLTELNNAFLVIATFFSFGAIWGGNQLYKSRLKNILPGIAVIEKLQAYRSAVIIKLGVLEGATIFTLISFFIIANYLYFLFAGLIIAIFFFNAPSVTKIVSDLKLSEKEKDEIIKMAENTKK